MTFLECLNLPKFYFTENLIRTKINKLQQSQALTSHFECFWSIVLWYLIRIGKILKELEKYFVTKLLSLNCLAFFENYPVGRRKFSLDGRSYCN